MNSVNQQRSFIHRRGARVGVGSRKGQSSTPLFHQFARNVARRRFVDQDRHPLDRVTTQVVGESVIGVPGSLAANSKITGRTAPVVIG